MMPRYIVSAAGALYTATHRGGPDSQPRAGALELLELVMAATNFKSAQVHRRRAGVQALGFKAGDREVGGKDSLETAC